MTVRIHSRAVVFLVGCALILPVVRAGFEPVLSEIMASNDSVLADEDGEYPDWIEIQNVGDTAGDLAAWFLTDDEGVLMQWSFPATPLAPGELLVVFASDKNRAVSGSELHTNFKLSSGGEYLALVNPDGTTAASEFAPGYPPQVADLSYGLGSGTQVLVDASTLGRWHVPADASLGTTWTEDGFMDGTWNGPGASGFGYEDSPGSAFHFGDLIGTTIPSGTGNLYVRYPVSVTNAASVTGLELRVRYDDAYIAYLNGTEIHRTPNVPAAPTWNSNANSTHTDSLAVEFEVQDLSAHAHLLNEGGGNVLAFHLINRHGGNPSSDLLLAAELDATGAAASTGTLGYFQSPTPGANNSGILIEAGPVVHGVTRDVPLLDENGDLVVEAGIVPAAGRSVSLARLVYRVNHEDEVAAAMRDDGTWPDSVAGDGQYAGVIPSSEFAAGDMVRWVVLATDDQGATGSEPERLDPLAPQYFGTMVDDGFATAGARVFRWWVENEDWYYTNGSTPIHKEYTGCSVFFDGEFYDNVRVRARGASSVLLNAPVQSLHFNFHPSHRLRYFAGEDRVDRINLNWLFVDQLYLRNQLSMDSFAAAGVHAPASEMVVVHQNGAYHNVGNIIEHPDEFFLRRRGLDPDGALYKVYNRLENANDRPEWTPGTSPNSLVGVEKKTRPDEDNTDLAAFIAGIDSGNANRFSYLMDNLDVPAVLNYMAASVIDSAHDVFNKNSFVYRDTEGSGEWLMLPWDRDVSWGQGTWNRNPIEWDHSQRSHPYYGSGINGASSAHRYEIYEAVLDEPVLREMFERRMRTILDEQLQPPGTPPGSLLLESRISELVNSLGRVAPADEPDNWIQLDKDLYGKLRGSPGQSGYSSTTALQSLGVAVSAIVDAYLPNRRVYLYHTMGSSGAGIVPDVQSLHPAVNFSTFDANPLSGNQDEEFIEISNPNDFAVDISGWTVTGGITHSFRPGTILPAAGGAGDPDRGKLYLTPSAAAFRLRSSSPTGGEGRLVQGGYDGHLSNFGERLELHAGDGTLLDILVTPMDPSVAQQFLMVSEVMYHPVGDGLAEYIELMNVGPETLDLTGVKFTEGIEFAFAGSAVTSLGAGARVLVVRDLAAFEAVHGAGLPVAGEFGSGTALDNNTDSLKLEDPTNSTIAEFRYKDSEPWPVDADGVGYSLVASSPGPANPEHWRSSVALGGTPGRSDSTSFVGDPGADIDGDGIADLLRYATTGDLQPFSNPRIEGVVWTPPGDEGQIQVVEFRYLRNLAADDVTHEVWRSTDLRAWQLADPAHFEIFETNNGDGTSTVVYRGTQALGEEELRFMRLQVGLKP